MIQRTPNDPAWYKGGLYHDNEPFGVPSLWLMSWYDISIGPNLALFNHVRENAEDPEVADNQFAVIAPVAHCGFRRSTEDTIVGERNMGDARFDYDGPIYGWFDYWLKGENNGVLENTPKVQYYMMGKNEWQSSPTWPPEGAEMVTYYLDSAAAPTASSATAVLIPAAPTSKREPTASPTTRSTRCRPTAATSAASGNAVSAGSYRPAAHGGSPRHPGLHDRAARGRRRGQRHRSRSRSTSPRTPRTPISPSS